jgi:hypothetical protein
LTEKKDIRKFGTIALVFFGALFGLAVWREKTAAAWFFGCLGALGGGFVLLPGFLRPIYTAWLTTAHLIGKLVTTVVLTLAYYLVITPSALLKRLLGGRPLPMRPDRHADTYWVDRQEPVQPKARFIKRY